MRYASRHLLAHAGNGNESVDDMAADGLEHHDAGQSDTNRPLTNDQADIDTRSRQVGGANIAKSGEGRSETAASPERCFVAVLPRGEKLIDIRVLSGKTGAVKHFFYQGFGSILGGSVTVSSYVPRFGWALPWWMRRAVASWDLPNIIERQLQYIASVSLALAVLNMAPVFWLDGEASAELFARLLLPKTDSYLLAKAKSVLLTVGTGLLALNLLLALID
jgi:hypothetical protein